ncbi:hypothetical protein C5167_018401, partial [Papaver somniferum]
MRWLVLKILIGTIAPQLQESEDKMWWFLLMKGLLICSNTKGDMRNLIKALMVSSFQAACGDTPFLLPVLISRAANAFWTSFASMTLDFNATSTLVTSLTTCWVALLLVNFETSDLCFGADRKDKTDSKTARSVRPTKLLEMDEVRSEDLSLHNCVSTAAASGLDLVGKLIERA